MTCAERLGSPDGEFDGWPGNIFAAPGVSQADGLVHDFGSIVDCKFMPSMRTTLTPGTRGSARLEDVPEPAAADGALLMRALALGVCGTPDIIMECAGAPAVIREVLGRTSPGGIACLLSIEPCDGHRYRPGQSQNSARQRGRVRLGECQSGALPYGSRSLEPRRARLARTPGHAARSPSKVERSARALA